MRFVLLRIFLSFRILISYRKFIWLWERPLTDKCYANNVYVVGFVSCDSNMGYQSTRWTNFYGFDSGINLKLRIFFLSPWLCHLHRQNKKLKSVTILSAKTLSLTKKHRWNITLIYVFTFSKLMLISFNREQKNFLLMEHYLQLKTDLNT